MIVMKFGGTSVESAGAIERVAGIVRSQIARKPVVVVSAMGKTTNKLLAIAADAVAGELKPALAKLAELREFHLRESSGLDVEDSIEEHFQELDALVRGLSVMRELTPRATDAISAYGERISSLVVTAHLRRCGMNTAHLDSRNVIVTDRRHTLAAPIFEQTNRRLRETLVPMLEHSVVVMGGFVAATEDGVTTTLGRGGSDYTASIVGAGIGAQEIQIWTDVDGMLTADPTVLPGAAHRVKVCSFTEAAELAYFGAKVLHPATVLPAIQKNIPVYILNSMNPSCEGTRIAAQGPHCKNFFKAIAAKKRITIVDVAAPRMLLAHGFLRSIFEAFDRHRIPVDVVSTSEVSVSLTVDSNEQIPALAADLARLADVKYEGRKAIVCLVGENLREVPGIAAHVFGELSDVKIRMISQGASEINLTFVIDEDQVPAVVKRLHGAFFKDPDPEVFA
jgi:aspartate kinase